MTPNDHLKIRFHKVLRDTDSYGLGTMPLITPSEAVEVELPDGTLLCGVVMSEWDEIRSQSRVLTKTIRVHSIEKEKTE